MRRPRWLRRRAPTPPPSPWGPIPSDAIAVMLVMRSATISVTDRHGNTNSMAFIGGDQAVFVEGPPKNDSGEDLYGRERVARMQDHHGEWHES